MSSQNTSTREPLRAKESMSTDFEATTARTFAGVQLMVVVQAKGLTGICGFTQKPRD